MPRRRKRSLKPIDARMIAETFLCRQDLKGYFAEFVEVVPSVFDDDWIARFQLGTWDGYLIVLVDDRTRAARFSPFEAL